MLILYMRDVVQKIRKKAMKAFLINFIKSWIGKFLD